VILEQLSDPFEFLRETKESAYQDSTYPINFCAMVIRHICGIYAPAAQGLRRLK